MLLWAIPTSLIVHWNGEDDDEEDGEDDSDDGMDDTSDGEDDEVLGEDDEVLGDAKVMAKVIFWLGAAGNWTSIC